MAASLAACAAVLSALAVQNSHSAAVPAAVTDAEALQPINDAKKVNGEKTENRNPNTLSSYENEDT